jgi:hypothetical protein
MLFLYTLIANEKPSPQCCGLGIRCLFDSCIRDPGWVKNQGPESVTNIPDKISESLETIFGLKILKFFDADPDPKSGIFLTLDQGSGMEEIGAVSQQLISYGATGSGSGTLPLECLFLGYITRILFYF